MTGPTDGSPQSLERRLGPIDAAAIVVSNVIGGGIFFVPVLVAQMVPSPRAFLLPWLAGGILAFAGAMAYAELGALKPKAGGEYVYLREAYGPFLGFLTGWTSFVAGFSGAIAASALAVAEYLGRFVPAAGDATPLVTLPIPLVPVVVSPRTLVALAVIAVITAVHMRGLGPGRIVQNSLAALKVAALVVLIAAGWAIGHGQFANVTAAPVGAGATAGGLLAALVPIMFTYSGWNAAAYVAEEVRTPGRNVPLALALGTLTVIAIYLALNALYLFALPIAELAHPPGALLDTVASRLFGGWVGALVAAFTVVSIAAGISAMTLAGPRVYFAMARDGLFPASAARVHPRFHVPAPAIVAQALWSGILVLCGSLSQLVNYTGFAIILFSSLAVGAVFILRRRDASVRPFRALGYPWLPALFVVSGAAILASEIARVPRDSLLGLAVIGVGIPLYWVARRSRRRA